MRQLSLVGISEDGTRLVLTASGPPPDTEQVGPGVGGEPAGEFTVALDDRLRAATRGDRARLGQLQIRFESSLRPRDIQARIRAGETPEQVARVAGIPIDRVLRFATPVLAEREHVAAQARRHPLHRRSEPGGTSLDDAVTARLSGHGVDPAEVAWDAHRRDDGAWVVTAVYPGGTRERTATFRFDPAARRAVAEDDDAHWIAGEAAGPTPVGRRPRLAAVDPSGAPRQLSAADAFDAVVADELAAAAVPRGPEGFGRDGAPEPAASRAAGVGIPDEETIDVPFAGSWPEMPAPDDARSEAAGDEESGRARPSRTRTFARRERTPVRPVQSPAPGSVPVAPLGSAPVTEHELTATPSDPVSDRPAADEPTGQGETGDGVPVEDTAVQEAAEPEAAEQTAQRRPGARNRRQAVPSWDEIMFGRKGD